MYLKVILISEDSFDKLPFIKNDYLAAYLYLFVVVLLLFYLGVNISITL